MHFCKIGENDLPEYKYERSKHLTKEEVKDMVEKSRFNYMQALISFLYLFGCRINEALKLNRGDIHINDDYVYAYIPISKRKNKQIPPKRHVIKISRNSSFMHYFLKYIEDKETKEKIFDFTRQLAWLRIKEVNPDCSPQLFRHSRLTRLAKMGASSEEIKDFAGWRDIRPCSSYNPGKEKPAYKLADKIE